MAWNCFTKKPMRTEKSRWEISNCTWDIASSIMKKNDKIFIEKNRGEKSQESLKLCHTNESLVWVECMSSNPQYSKNQKIKQNLTHGGMKEIK